MSGFYLNGFSIPSIRNLRESELEEMREHIAEVLGLDESDVELEAYDNDTNEPWE